MAEAAGTRKCMRLEPLFHRDPNLGGGLGSGRPPPFNPGCELGLGKQHIETRLIQH